MISQIAGNLQSKPHPLILTPTRLKDNFEKNKYNLAIEGRQKTIDYLEEDFSNFMRFLDDLLKNLEVDPFCQYAKMAKDVRKFIDEITPGLYSLKKTYPDTKEMVAKVDSIILCLCDFKDKTEDYIKQKNKGIKLLIKKKAFEV